jgi:hypothetical protein
LAVSASHSTKAKIHLKHVAYDNYKPNKNVDTISSIYLNDLNCDQLEFNYVLNPRESTLDNICQTCISKFLFAFIGTEYYFIHCANLKIMYSQDLSIQNQSLEYFLSPTNLSATKLLNSNGLRNTDSVISINDLGQLVLIDFDNMNKKANIIKSSPNLFKFHTFKLNNTKMVAYDQLNAQLVVYDLESFVLNKNIKTFSFNDTFARISLTSSIVNNIGIDISSTYLYLVEKKNILLFYRLKDSKRLAQVPLYSKVHSIICNNSFICMAMQDKRVLSFLIAEPNEESIKRIKNLESRY